MSISEPKRKACPGRRLFVPEVSEEATEVVLTGPQKRYVRDVLRMGPGDALVLFNGSGIEYPSAITETTRRHVKVRILGRQECGRESPIDILIGIGLLKTNKMDWIIQKVSELGVREVHPFAAHRTVAALDPKRAEQRRGRWQTIAQEASRQSGRSTVTDVRPLLSFDEIVRQSEHVDLSLLFTTEAISPLEALARRQVARPQRMLLLVGPEGGFTPEEEQIAANQGFLPVGLGPRVLRAETAAILAVGLLQYRFGDLGGSPGDLTPQGP